MWGKRDKKMTMNLEDLISRNITLTRSSNNQERVEIKKLGQIQELKKTDQFEKDVFTFLFKNKSKLGIDKLFRIYNCRIDGALKLRDRSEFVLLEIKYRLNWFKACNARIEFQLFNNHFVNKLTFIDRNEIHSGLIIFEEFSGDWKKQAKKRKRKNGWYLFYEEENFLKSNDFKIDIGQFKDNKLRTVNNNKNIKGGLEYVALDRKFG